MRYLDQKTKNVIFKRLRQRSNWGWDWDDPEFGEYKKRNVKMHHHSCHQCKPGDYRQTRQIARLDNGLD